MIDHPSGPRRREFLGTVAGAALATLAPPLLAAPSATPSGGAVTLSEADLHNLLYGLGFAASGGGGGYLIGEALVKAIIRDIDPSRWVLHDVASAADGDFAVMAGGIGAPSAITPDTILDFVGYANLAIQAYSNNSQVVINALVPVEAGPVNALLALYLGWKMGYKVFDCDGAGRAVPSLTNLVFGYNSYPIAPVWLAGVIQGSPTPLLVSPPPADAAAAEGAIRDNLGQFGDAAGLVCWGQTGAQLRTSSHLLAGTLSRLVAFGAAAAATGFTKDALVAFLKSRPEVIAVYSGVVKAIQPGSQPGYDDGYVIVGGDTGGQFQIHYLNENMIVTSGASGQNIVATAPSGIAMMFQPNGAGSYLLLNNGDNLPQQSVIGFPMIFAVMKESCTLFNSPVGDSFAAVLSSPPFNYKKPFVPAGICTP